LNLTLPTIVILIFFRSKLAVVAVSDRIA